LHIVVDVATLIKLTWAVNSGFLSLLHLLKSDIPALGDFVVTKLENFWPMKPLSRVLNQFLSFAIHNVAFPMDHDEVINLAEASVFNFSVTSNLNSIHIVS
jgi:hypothetical protein